MSGYSFWDTNLFIYWLEQPNHWSDRIEALREWHREQNLKVITSSLTAAELLVHPLTQENEILARKYHSLIKDMGCLSFGPDEAWVFAQLRSAYPRIKPPDAIQFACAAVKKVSYFFTNDVALKHIHVDGIQKVQPFEEWPS